MKIYIISGGPSTGKTSVINALKKKGYKVLIEAARYLGDNDKRFKGKSIKGIDKKKFQDAIFELQKKQIVGLKNEKIVFSDRGLGDTIAYYRINKLKVPKNLINYAKKFKYSGIFILDFLDFYEVDKLRKETKEEQEFIQREIIKSYKELGYGFIIVPFMSIEDRSRFIISKIKN